MKKNGENITNYKGIKQELYQYFKSLLTDQEESNPTSMVDMLNNISTTVTLFDNLVLAKDVEEFEVIDFIWGLEPNKPLGPDVLSISFYRCCWYTIKHAFSKMIRCNLKKGKNEERFLLVV